MAETTPTLLHGRYEVVALIGRGGEGTVVRAVDRRHGRDVALKVRRVPADPRDAERLLTESRTLLSLRPHSGLSLARDDFFEDDHHVLVLDWVDGVDLGRILAEHGRPGLPPSTVLRWLAPIAEALTYLHTTEPPVVHGDVKPNNLILTPRGEVVLVDFGVSSTRGRRSRGGTPGYRAPEADAAGPLPRSADVYGLAATAFALLAGGPPTGILPRWDDVDPVKAARLEQALRHGLATNPTSRTSTPGELVEELRSGWDTGHLPTGVLTFLATDVVSSTRLWQDLPDTAPGLLAEHLLVVDRAVERHRGQRVGDTLDGDATVSVFHRASDAVLAGIDLQRALTGRIPAQCAAHTGEALAADRGYAGATRSRVAGIRALADAGQLLLSATTARLAASDMPADIRFVALGPHRLAGFDQPEALVAVDAEGLAVPPDPSLPPFPGLAAFQPVDLDVFFGREELVAHLTARLVPGGLVAVVGPSGSGKTSLLRAGVIPRVECASLITPGDHPAMALDGAGSGPLVVDQLEELFTLCHDADERAVFADQILGRPHGCLVTMRADFYGHLAELPRLAAAVADDHILLGPLDNDQLRRAIEGPAGVRGLVLEPGLVELVLTDARAEPGALPLIAHALSETWQRREGRTLTVAGYRSTGGVQGALVNTAEHLYAGLDEPSRDLLRTILLRMVQPGDGVADTRRRVTRDELTPLGEPGAVDAVLERLTAARLVSLEHDTAEPTHEALLRAWPRLRHWIDDEREGLRLHRNLTGAAHEWELGGRDPAELYRGVRLANAVDWRARQPRLTPSEQSFLDAADELADAERRSAEQRARQQLRVNRRLRALLAGVAFLLIAALTAGLVATQQARHADRAAARADAQARIAAGNERRATDQAAVATALALAAQVDDVQASNPALGLALAAEAVTLTDPPRAEATAALFRARIKFGARSWQPVGEPLTGHDGVVTAVAFNHDGTLLASASTDRTVRLWDPATGDPVGEPLTGHDRVVTAVAFNHDGTLLASASTDRTVRLWDPATGEPVGEPLTGQDHHVRWVAFNHDGTLLASAGEEGTVRLWDPTTRKPAGEPLVSDDTVVRGLAFNHDGSLLASAGEEGAIRLWDLATRAQVGHELAGPGGWRVKGLAFNHDGSLLASGGGDDGTVRLWDPRTGTPVGDPLPGHDGDDVTGVAFNHDGTLLASAGDDGTVRLHDPVARTLVGDPLTGHDGPVTGVAFNHDGTLLASAGADGTVRLWDPRPGTPVNNRLTDDFSLWEDVTFSEDGTLLAVAGVSGVRLWDAATGTPVGDFRVDDDGTGLRLSAVAFNHDGTLLATAGTDGLRLWDPTTGNAVGDPLGSERVARRSIRGVAFNHDGTLLATAGTDGLRLWDPTTGNPVGDPLVGHPGPVTAVAFNHDGTLLASTGTDGLRLWDPTTGNPVGDPLVGHPGPVTAVAFNHDGTLLASTGTDGLRLWDPTTGNPVRDPLVGHPGPVTAVAFNHDGTLLASTGTDGLRLWDPTTGNPVGDPLVGHPGPVTAVAFNHDGTALATSGADGGVWTWDDIWEQSEACTLAAPYVTADQVEPYLGLLCSALDET